MFLGKNTNMPPDVPEIRCTRDPEEPFDLIALTSAPDSEQLEQILARPRHRIMPVLDFSGTAHPRADFTADVLSPMSLTEGLRVADDLLSRISSFPDFSQSKDGEAFSVLCLAATRARPILAAWLPDSRRVIDYPLCSGLVNARSLLESLADDGMFRREFYHRVHLCTGCGSSRLSAEEQCVSCGNGQLVESAFIHHHACGFQAPEAAFRQGREYVCPKCRRKLHHFGVDYDKPGNALACAACHAVMGEPSVAFVCMDCQHVTPTDGAETIDWFHYHLTDDGRKALLTLRLPRIQFAQLLDRLDQALTLRDFLFLADHDLRTSGRYGRPWSLCHIDVTGAQTLREGLGRHAANVVFSKLVELIQGATRNSDYLTSKGDAILIAMPETCAENARLVVDRLIGEARATLSKSLGIDYVVHEGEGARELLGAIP